MANIAAIPILKGTLGVLILKAVSWGPMHGFGIASWLDQHSGGVVGIDDSALYQALHRLEERGYVQADWGITENNRRARYYRLTTAGRRQLQSEVDSWLQYAQSVTAILTRTVRPA